MIIFPSQNVLYETLPTRFEVVFVSKCGFTGQFQGSVRRFPYYAWWEEANNFRNIY